MSYRSNTDDNSWYIVLAVPRLQEVAVATEMAMNVVMKVMVAVVVMAALVKVALVKAEVVKASETLELANHVKPCLHRSGYVVCDM
jgi:hypothetical protein